MGPGLVQAKMESTALGRNVHTGWGRWQGSAAIISYCTSPVPIPVQCEWNGNLVLHSVVSRVFLFCIRLAELVELGEFNWN